MEPIHKLIDSIASLKISSSKKPKQRSFKVIVSTVKIVKGTNVEWETLLMDLFKGEEFYGRYLGDSPNQAAKKAFTQIFRKLKNKVLEDTDIIFTLKESTQDSDKKEYTYKGMAIHQLRYMIVKKDNTGKRRVEYTSDVEDITTEVIDGKEKLKRNEGEEVYKIPFKTKIVSLRYTK